MTLRSSLKTIADGFREAITGRAAPQGAEPYRGGEINRLNKPWQPEKLSGDAAINLNWDLLTRRIRDLGRNDPALIALKRAQLDHVVGDGIGTTASVKVGDELDDEFNTEADEEWDWWLENEADVSGKLGWPDLQRQVYGEMLETGEGLLLECARNDPARQTPLCYQSLEAEQLDANKDQPPRDGQNEIIRGVEVDRWKMPVAYWLFDVHPGDYHHFSLQSVRMPAERVLHVTLPGRPSQVRAASLYNCITMTARDLDNYLGNELTASNIGSLFTLVHKTQTPGTGMGFTGDGTDTSTTDDAGNPKLRLGRGIVCQIPHKDTIEPVEASHPNRDARVFTDLMLLLLSMGGNVSPYRLTRDYSGTTYVAARAAHLDDRAAFRPMQGYLARTLCLPVRRRWTELAVAGGVITSVSAQQFRRQQRRWQRVKVVPPAYEDIDPEKATDADIAAVGAGFATQEDVCARRGKKDWRRVILQRKREIAFAKKHGVPTNYDRPSTPAKPRASDEPKPTEERT